MKSIKEQQTEYVLAHTDAVESYEAYAEKEEIAAAFEAGALSVCNAIDEAIANLKLGKTPMERFYKFDILAEPKQEWSEEDKAILEKCISAVKVSCYSYSFKSEAENWLKSLRPQKQKRWKPTEEQIKVCKEVYADILSAKGFDLGTINSELNRLEEQLKKL